LAFDKSDLVILDLFLLTWLVSGREIFGLDGYVLTGCFVNFDTLTQKHLKQRSGAVGRDEILFFSEVV
jgi:hypothetical protein